MGERRQRFRGGILVRQTGPAYLGTVAAISPGRPRLRYFRGRRALAVSGTVTQKSTKPIQPGVELMDHNQAFENRTFDNRMEALAGQALEILPRMAIASGPSQGLFCERLRPVPSDQLASGQLEQIGVSARYTIRTMIGVAEAR